MQPRMADKGWPSGFVDDRTAIKSSLQKISVASHSDSRLCLKCDGTHAENGFRLSAKRTSLFKSAGGRQFIRLLAAEVCVSAVVMLDTRCSEVV